MSKVNDSFYKGHTKQKCFSKINPITKLLKDLYNISFHTLNNKGKMKGSQSCQICNQSSHGTRTVLPKAKPTRFFPMVDKSLARHILTTVTIFLTSFYLKIDWLFRGIICKAR